MLNNDLLSVINYDDADFVWISAHYDIHLAGLLKFHQELCRFETDFDTSLVTIYRLSWLEKIIWILRKKLFESCVGKHFSYPERRNGVCFKWRRNVILHKMAFKLYYSLLTKI